MKMVSSLLLCCWMRVGMVRPAPRPAPPLSGRRTVKEEGAFGGWRLLRSWLRCLGARRSCRQQRQAGVRRKVLPGAGGCAPVRGEMCVAPRRAINPRGSGKPRGKALISSGIKGRLSSTGMGGPHGGLTEAAAPGGPPRMHAPAQVRAGWCRGAVQRRPQHYAMLSTSV